jgi:colanic acid biosynthesis glycosyl transferase WcaI
VVGFCPDWFDIQGADSVKSFARRSGRTERECQFYGILAAGRPLVFIGDRKGEISLLVKREGIGLAVRQGDAAGLANQLIGLAGDVALREVMGTRALLCERYDKRIAFKAWLELLGEL